MVKRNWVIAGGAKVKRSTACPDKIIPDLPDEVQYVVVCANDRGLKPIFVCKKDQIYIKRIDLALRQQNLTGAVSICVMPVDRSALVDIAYR